MWISTISTIKSHFNISLFTKCNHTFLQTVIKFHSSFVCCGIGWPTSANLSQVINVRSRNYLNETG
jgi:hypothetical protein